MLKQAAAAGAPAIDIDPFSIPYFDDPYAYHARLRDAAPVVFLPQYGVYAVARYAEVKAVLENFTDYCSGRGAGLQDFAKETPWRPPSLLLEKDPPEHTGPRRVLMRVLSAPAMEKLRAQFTATAITVIEAALAKGRIDGITDLAQAYPMAVFPDAVGLKQEGREHLLPYAALAFNAFGPDNELRRNALAAAAPHVEYVNAQVQRDQLDEVGFGAQVFAAADRGEITYEQAPVVVRSMLTAGIDTTVNGLGAALQALMDNPEEWDKLRANPALARGAFTEALRLETPLQTFFRTTTRDVELAGVCIPEGTKILVLMSAANRDPRRWDEPDRYDINRRTLGHVGFGAGIHMCVGQLVAALEGEVLLSELAKRVTRMTADGAPVRSYNNTLRGLASLPMRVS